MRRFRSLLAQRCARKRNLKMFKEACEPIQGAEQAIKELMEERRRYEERLERKIGA